MRVHVNVDLPPGNEGGCGRLSCKIESRTMNVRRGVLERILSREREQELDGQDAQQESLSLRYCHHICKRLSGKLDYVHDLDLVGAVTFDVPVEVCKPNRGADRGH